MQRQLLAQELLASVMVPRIASIVLSKQSCIVVNSQRQLHPSPKNHSCIATVACAAELPAAQVLSCSILFLHDACGTRQHGLDR